MLSQKLEIIALISISCIIRLPVLILDNRPPKHLRNCIDRSNFYRKSLTSSCLICVLSLKVAKKIAQKGKNCLRLSEPQEVSPNAKRCSEVAENNPERPYQRPEAGICEILGLR